MADLKVAVPGHIQGKDLFVLRPDGDSMDQVVPEGGFIVVDPNDKDLVHKRYYVVMNDAGDTTFKRFDQEAMQLSPCSNNPDHKPIPVGQERFLVIGRVIYAGSDL